MGDADRDELGFGGVAGVELHLAVVPPVDEVPRTVDVEVRETDVAALDAVDLLDLGVWHQVAIAVAGELEGRDLDGCGVRVQQEDDVLRCTLEHLDGVGDGEHVDLGEQLDLTGELLLATFLADRLVLGRGGVHHVAVVVLVEARDGFCHVERKFDELHHSPLLGGTEQVSRRLAVLQVCVRLDPPVEHVVRVLRGDRDAVHVEHRAAQTQPLVELESRRDLVAVRIGDDDDSAGDDGVGEQRAEDALRHHRELTVACSCGSKELLGGLRRVGGATIA